MSDIPGQSLPYVVILAAGASTRMLGADKLLEDVDGQPVLRRVVQAALDAGAAKVAVTLPPPQAPFHAPRLRALSGLTVDPLIVPDADTGMSASLRVAAQWAVGNPLLVCPGDMPELTDADFAQVLNAYHGKTVRAVAADGTPGHPVLFPPEAMPDLQTLTGDEGARSILRSFPPTWVTLPARHAVTDLDTPEDWAAWRASRS